MQAPSTPYLLSYISHDRDNLFLTSMDQCQHFFQTFHVFGNTRRLNHDTVGHGRYTDHHTYL